MEFNYKQEPGRKMLNRYCIPNELPLISIVTPYYNAGKYFEQTWNSVMNQTFPYFEWIIVDDGSTNETDVQLLQRYGQEDRRIKIFRKENGGAAGARNYGVEQSHSEIIVFLDADDLIDCRYLEYVYCTLSCNPDADWAYMDSVGFFEKEYLWQKEFSSNVMKRENVLPYMSAVRKNVFLAVGGYNAAEKNMWEDWQFWLKLLRSEYRPAHIKQLFFWYRRLSSGALAAIEQNATLKKKLLAKIEQLSKNVPDGVRAITFDGKRKTEFQKPKKWEWDRQLTFQQAKTRILFLLPHMERGGADKFNLDILTNIDRDKFEIGIITTIPAQSEWRQLFTENAIDVFELPSFLHMEDWSSFIHYYIQSRNVDVVMNISSYYGYYLLPWLRKEFPELGILDCVHAEGKYWRAGGYPRVSAVVDSIIEKTFVTNEYTRQIMVSGYGKPVDKTQVIYTGVDEAYFDPTGIDGNDIRRELGINANRPVVLYLCRIAAEKRPFLMLEIAKAVQREILDICFLVVGDGPQLGELRQEIQRQRLEKLVYVIGRQEDIRPYYAASDLSLVCSLKEGLSITTFESMAMETPVVSADVGGQKELVDNQTGRLIPCLQDEAKDFDRREFAEQEILQYVAAIEDLLSDQGRLAEMGKQCRARILSGYTLRDMINVLEREFSSIKQGAGLKERRQLSESLQSLTAMVDDYLTIYSEYEYTQAGYGRFYKAMQLLQGGNPLGLWRNPIFRGKVKAFVKGKIKAVFYTCRNKRVLFTGIHYLQKLRNKQ